MTSIIILLLILSHILLHFIKRTNRNSESKELTPFLRVSSLSKKFYGFVTIHKKPLSPALSPKGARELRCLLGI